MKKCEVFTGDKLFLFGLIFALFGFIFSFFSTQFPIIVSGAILDISFGLSIVLFIVSGSEFCRKIARYGIGTGVPSVSMYSIGIGTVCAIFGFSLFNIISGFGGYLAGVAAGLIFGFVCGFFTNKYLNMNISDFTRNMSFISGASTAAFMSGGIFLFASFESIIYLRNMVLSGFVAILFIGTAVMIFHAYNASLGADESQDRTQTLSFTNSFLWLFLLSLISAYFKPQSVVLIILLSIISFIYFFIKHFKLVKRDAYKISGAALLPTEEELL